MASPGPRTAFGSSFPLKTAERETVQLGSLQRKLLKQPLVVNSHRKWNHHDGSAPLARLRIKHCMGFRQFLLRGQGKVSLEWSLVCLAYNFKRLYRMTGGKGLPEKVAI